MFRMNIWRLLNDRSGLRMSEMLAILFTASFLIGRRLTSIIFPKATILLSAERLPHGSTPSTKLQLHIECRPSQISTPPTIRVFHANQSTSKHISNPNLLLSDLPLHPDAIISKYAGLSAGCNQRISVGNARIALPVLPVAA